MAAPRPTRDRAAPRPGRASDRRRAAAVALLEDLYGGPVPSEGCPSRFVLGHVTSKWGVLVLVALAGGTLRWGELRRAVEGISEKMLAQTLQTLERDGLVHREARPVVPPHVEYGLTPLGDDLLVHLLPLVVWSAEHGQEIRDRWGVVDAAGAGEAVDGK